MEKEVSTARAFTSGVPKGSDPEAFQTSEQSQGIRFAHLFENIAFHGRVATTSSTACSASLKNSSGGGRKDRLPARFGTRSRTLIPKDECFQDFCELILTAFPAAASFRDRQKRALPLHIVAENGSPVYEQVALACPDALWSKSSQLLYPFQSAVSGYDRFMNEDDSRRAIKRTYLRSAKDGTECLGTSMMLGAGWP